MKLRTQSHTCFSTKDGNHQENGFVIPIFSEFDAFVDENHFPKQVYLTVCKPGTRKGPHLHMKRWGYFTCIRGNVRIVARLGTEYVSECTGEDFQYQTIEVPAGTPAVIENIGKVDAYVINTPSPAWHKDDQDENPVTDWHEPQKEKY